MSYKPENYVERYRQIMPAPGWTALRCCIPSDDDTATFMEVPVVGWGVYGHEVAEPEMDDTIERRDDEIKLLVLEENRFVVPFDDDPQPAWRQTAIFAPGVSPTEADRAELEKAVRAERTWRAKQEQKAAAAAAGSSK